MLFRLVCVSADSADSVEHIRLAILEALPEDYRSGSITGDMVRQGDVVLLVMPQDAQAPKGRLILPQVQTIRELLDKKCIVVSCTPDDMQSALAALASPPQLIITDSQVFGQNKPIKGVEDFKGLKIRSFTPSMAKLIEYFGAIPVTLSFSEVYPALQRGVMNCDGSPGGFALEFTPRTPWARCTSCVSIPRISAKALGER